MFAAGRLPTNVASGLVVGGVQGFRKGSGKTEETSPVSTAIGQVSLNTLWGQAYAGATGFLIGGPVGMAANMAMDAIGAGAGIYVFVKNGSAKEVGKRMADAVDSAVKKDDGAAMGTIKGMGAGGWASMKAAAVTGWREGKGTGAGLVDGTKAAWDSLQLTRLPKEGLLKSGLKATAGIATAALALPAGAVLALATPVAERETPGLLKRLAIAGATGAATGAAVGFLGGPVGMAVGAGIGAAVNLIGPAGSKKLATRVMTAVRRTEKKKDELGSDIANNNRAMFSKSIQGSFAAASQAWNISVKPDEAPKSVDPGSV